MEIKTIINKLSDYNLTTIVEIPELTYIQTHKMINPKKDFFYSTCLYVGYVSELPDAVSANCIANIICIEDEPLPDFYKSMTNVNMYLTPIGTNQFDILNKIADIMIDEATLVASMRKILDALYSNQGLQLIVDVASELFENPIFINDPAYKILAMSSSFPLTNPTLEEEKLLGYVHPTNIKAMKRDLIYAEGINTHKGILSSKRIDTGETWLFSAVKIHEVTIAQIAIVDSNRNFRELDYELLKRFTQIIAIELEKNDFYKINRGLMYNYLLDDLLNGKTTGQKNLQQRLNIVDWKIYNWFKIMIITDHRKNISPNKTALIVEQIKHILPDCHWVINNHGIVFFISRPNEHIFTSNELNLITSFLKSNYLLAGISLSFSDLLETPHYYKQAFRAVDIGFFIKKKEYIFNYSDIMPYYAANILLKKNNLLDFCNDEIKKFWLMIMKKRQLY